MTDAEHGLDLDALLDPARLAAAWQTAHARPASETEIEIEAEAEAELDDAFAAEPTDPGELRDPPLAVALAHRQLLAELEASLAASPAIADKARRVLSGLLAKLATTLDPGDLPLDLAAAERALDQLEDAWQAVLSDAGWPPGDED